MVPLGVLAGAAVALLVLTAVSARRPRAPLPDMDGYQRRWSRLHGGYDPRSSAWVHGWLRVTFLAARPLARRGLQPDVLTLWGAWASLAVLVPAAAGDRWPLLAGLLVVVSAWADALDGTVAALTNRATPWGSVLDSMVDRVADGAYLVAVWLAGGAAGLALVAGACGFLQEYARARAGNAGMDEVGVVTVGERPTRVILCALGLVAAGLLPAQAEVLTTGVLGVLAVLSAVGLGQLVRYVRRRLSVPAAPAHEDP